MTAIIGQKSIFVAKELKIVQKAYDTGHVKVMCEFHEVRPKQVRYWRARAQKVNRKAI